MPSPNTPTQRSQALALLKRRGMTRLAEFHEAGITATTVSRMEQAGEVVRRYAPGSTEPMLDVPANVVLTTRWMAWQAPLNCEI